MGWIDSHCHLDFTDFDQASLMPQLIDNDCEAVLVPATQAKYFDRVVALREHYPNVVKIALGLHPFFMDEHKEHDIELLDQAITQAKPDAIGEFGLDFMLPEDSFDLQFKWFNQQLLLAKQHRLPLVIHCRKAHDKIASEVRKSGFNYGGFIHGFSGSLQQAKRYIDLGFVVGLGGALTYERARAMHKMVAALPDDAYTLETDSPDMRPSFANGHINTPLNVPIIAEHIARLRGECVERVIKNSTRNVHRVLNIGL